MRLLVPLDPFIVNREADWFPSTIIGFRRRSLPQSSIDLATFCWLKWWFSSRTFCWPIVGTRPIQPIVQELMAHDEVTWNTLGERWTEKKVSIECSNLKTIVFPFIIGSHWVRYTQIHLYLVPDMHNQGHGSDWKIRPGINERPIDFFSLPLITSTRMIFHFARAEWKGSSKQRISIIIDGLW